MSVATRPAHRTRWLTVPVVFAVTLASSLAVLMVAPRRADAATRGDVVKAAAKWGVSHGYHVGISVYDTKTGQQYDAGSAHSTYASESVIKAMIAARLILQGRMHGATAQRAYYMITHSDDGIASSLYASAGGDGLVRWMANHYHVKDLGWGPSRAGWWGNNHINADGLVHLYAKFKADRRVGHWLINAMHHAAKYGSDGTYQWFGLHSANSHAAIKQGWGADYDDWYNSADFNTTGFVDGDRYAVAILARGPISRYGTEIGNALTRMARTILPHGTFPPGIPTITSMSTHRTSALGNRTLTLHGIDFEGVRNVTFGATAAKSWHVVSPTEIKVVTPAHEVSAGVAVRVITTHGTSNGKQHVWFYPPPTVLGVSPAAGPTAGGTSVRITGHYFFGPVRVRFGNAEAKSVKLVDGSTLVAVSPNADAATVDVRVITPYGWSPVVGADHFRYAASPGGASPQRAATPKHRQRSQASQPSPSSSPSPVRASVSAQPER